MPHELQLQKLYRRSDLHVYLSKPFVLSWSLLELMACGTPVLAEANSMMEAANTTWHKRCTLAWPTRKPGQSDPDVIRNTRATQKMGRTGTKKQLQPTYLQHHCLSHLEQLLQQQTSHCFLMTESPSEQHRYQAWESVHSQSKSQELNLLRKICFIC